MPSSRKPLMKGQSRGRTQSADWFTFRNVSDDEAEIDIYGQIGGFSWWDDEETVTAQSFRRKLKEFKNKSKITVHINSPGGSVFEGLAIYNALKQHDATIRVVVDALAASAASFIAMAADEGELIMARNAVMMIHDASGVAMGNAETMREMADLLDKHSDNIADIYSQRSGEDAAFWRMAMIEETWYTGPEAVEQGLADSLLEDEDEEAEKVAAEFDLSIFNYAGREQAPAPSVIHKRIKAQMNQAKENAVSGSTTTPKAHAEGEDQTTTPTEGETQTEETPTETPDEETTPPGNTPTEEAGATGDGAPQEGSEPENSLGPISMVINGVRTSDPKKIQAHITALETAQKEARDGSRKAFVAQLAASNRLPATQIKATEEFALELSDAQYEKWTAQWTNAASLPLLGQHGGGSTNHDGTGSTSTENDTLTQIETLEAIVKHHKQGNRTDEFIKNTTSYKTLIALKPDFKL